MDFVAGPKSNKPSKSGQTEVKPNLFVPVLVYKNSKLNEPVWLQNLSKSGPNQAKPNLFGPILVFKTPNSMNRFGCKICQNLDQTEPISSLEETDWYLTVS